MDEQKIWAKFKEILEVEKCVKATILPGQVMQTEHRLLDKNEVIKHLKPGEAYFRLYEDHDDEGTIYSKTEIDF